MTPKDCNHATANEHDYKWGFKTGFTNYSCEAGDLGSDDCGDRTGTSNGIKVVCSNAAENHFVANQTALADGYMNGWKHWCMTTTKDCARVTTAGYYPGNIQYTAAPTPGVSLQL